MQSTDDDQLILNVYELSTPSDGEAANYAFFQRMLSSVGMNTFHTSLKINGFYYIFGAGAGITKTRNSQIGVPPHATFQESISLGPCNLRQDAINEVMKRLGNHFNGTSYHLANRNCNHFTETFATALTMRDTGAKLTTYPGFVNRLAKTSSTFVNHGDVCNVLEEARHAAGDNIPQPEKKESSSSTTSSATGRQEKKQLTDKQKAILAKLKKGKS